MNIHLGSSMLLPRNTASKSWLRCVARVLALSCLATPSGPGWLRGDEPPGNASPAVESASSERASSERASSESSNPGLASTASDHGGTVVPSEESREESMKAWIGEWNAASFAVRRAASRRLESTGSDAYELLADAAIQSKPETTARALAILERGLRQADTKVKEVARESVERIAASDNASAARAAQEVLREADTAVAAKSRAGREDPFGAAAGVAALGNGVIIRPNGLPGRVQGGWPIGPIPPNIQAGQGMRGGPPGWMPGNVIAAQQAEMLRVLRNLDSSIAQTRLRMMQSPDPAERARLQQQLERSQDTRQRLQAIIPFR